MVVSKKSQLTTIQQVKIDDDEKLSLIENKVQKLNIVFEPSDIVNISANIKNEFKSKQSLNSQILSAIKNYFEQQNSLQLAEIQDLKNSIIGFENLQNEKTIECLQSLANELNISNSSWQQATNEILDMFS